MGVDEFYLWVPYGPMELNILPDYWHTFVIKGCSLSLCLTQMRCHRPVEQKCMKESSSDFGETFPIIKASKSLTWPVFACILLWILQAISMKYSPETFIIPEVNR